MMHLSSLSTMVVPRVRTHASIHLHASIRCPHVFPSRAALNTLLTFGLPACRLLAQRSVPTAPAARTTHRTADRAARSRELIYSIRALLVFAMRRYRVPCPRRSTHRVWIDNQIAGCKLCKHSTHRVWIHHQIAGCERADGASLVWCHVLVWSRVLIWCRACSSGAACARPVPRALVW